MKRKFSSLIWVFFPLTVMLGCQKDNVGNEVLTVKDEALIQKLKDIYTTKIESGTTSDKIFEGTPEWNELLSSATTGEYLVPVEITTRSVVEKSGPVKYLVISGSGWNGEYVYAFEKAGSINRIEKANQVFALLQKGKPEDEDIYIAKRTLHDAVDKKENTGSYVKNKIKVVERSLLKKGNDDTIIVANSYPVESCEEMGGTIVEIEWWYQTYVNGVLIYEEYVYSTYECWGGGGGGGGGTINTSGSCGSITSLQAIALLNQLEGEVTSQVSYSYIPILVAEKGYAGKLPNISVTRKSVVCKYSFYTLRLTKNSTVYAVNWSANFSGIVYKNNDPDFWKWESINFVNIVKQGTTPICMEYIMSANVATPIIDSDGKRAQSGVNYTITIKVACLAGWEVKSETGSIPDMYLYA